MKFTLRIKLIGLTALVVTFTMAGVTYFFSLRQLKDQRSAVESQMVRVARNIATMQLVDRQNWRGYQNYITQLIEFNDDIVYIAIYDDRNALRAQTLNSDLVEIENPAALTRREQAEIVRRLDQGHVASESRGDLRTQEVNIQTGDRVLGSVRVGFSLIELNNAVGARVTRNIGVGFLFIVVASLLATFFGSRLTGPLQRLNQAMEALARGNLDQKVRVENRDEIGQLAERFNEMVEGLRERSIIEKLGMEITKSFQLNELVSLVKDRLTNAIDVESTRIFIAGKNDRHRFSELTSENNNSAMQLTVDDRMRSYFASHFEGFMAADAPEFFSSRVTPCKVQPHDWFIPMFAKDKAFGLLLFSPRDQKTLDDPKQRQFMATLAVQASIALQNALLYDDLREQDRFRRELEIAKEVQHRLLPASMPSFPGFEFDGVCHSAQEVGGDYFDFLPIDDERLGIVIADVSGKGTSASFYMAEIKGMMISLTATNPAPRDLLCTLNARLYASLDRKIFATMIYGVLDTKRRTFRFARAGHDALMHITAERKCHCYTPPGIGIGLDRGKLFEQTLQEQEIALKKGDSLLLFTDGITEAMSASREEFGEERLVDIVCGDGEYDAKQLRRHIVAEVDAFVAGAEQHDDLTMVIVHCV